MTSTGLAVIMPGCWLQKYLLFMSWLFTLISNVLCSVCQGDHISACLSLCSTCCWNFQLFEPCVPSHCPHSGLGHKPVNMCEQQSYVKHCVVCMSEADRLGTIKVRRPDTKLSYFNNNLNFSLFWNVAFLNFCLHIIFLLTQWSFCCCQCCCWDI